VGKEELYQSTFDVEFFGATRYALEKVSLAGHLGFRINGDWEMEYTDPFFGGTYKYTVDGKASFLFGGAVLFAVSPQATLMGELDFETARIEEGETDGRLTFGGDFGLGETMHLRGGLGIGLTDGAPDFEILVGVAASLPS
jgi:hypothetical protein